MKNIETQRLLLRQFHATDLADLYSLIFSDPEVTKNYCGRIYTQEETKSWLSRLER